MRLAAASIAAFSAACTTPTHKLTRLVVTYTGAKPAAGGSTIQEDFPCHGP